MKQLDYSLANETEILTFLKSKYPLYHLSNVFFRDIQYGIQAFFFRKKMSIGYADAEKVARAFVAQLEKKKTLHPIDQQSWVLNFPEFKTQVTAPPAASKPAAKPSGVAPAAKSPAAAATPATQAPSTQVSQPAVASATPKVSGAPPVSQLSGGLAATKPEAPAPTEPQKSREPEG